MPDGGYSDGMTVLGRIWPLWMTGVATGAVFGLWMVVTQITFLPVGRPVGSIEYWPDVVGAVLIGAVVVVVRAGGERRIFAVSPRLSAAERARIFLTINSGEPSPEFRYQQAAINYARAVTRQGHR